MKTTFASSASVAQAMRYSISRMQADLIKAQKEASTGTVADIGLALGSRTGQAVSFKRDMERLEGLIDANGLASSRLKATQNAMIAMNDAAQSFIETLTTSASGGASKSVTQAAGQDALQSITSLLNTSFNGEYLFAGINTDVKPIDDFTAPGSACKAAFTAAFQGYFGFAQSSPAAANITASQMNDFMATVLEPQFIAGAAWQASWSSASDTPIQSRIALNETANTSVSANNDGSRKLIVIAGVISELFSTELSGAACTVLVERAVALVGEGMARLADLQAETGIAENRISRASEKLDMQVDLFQRNILDLEGVDPTEVATRVSSLLTQIETSYALTARIQQLSIMRFLT